MVDNVFSDTRLYLRGVCLEKKKDAQAANLVRPTLIVTSYIESRYSTFRSETNATPQCESTFYSDVSFVMVRRRCLHCAEFNATDGLDHADSFRLFHLSPILGPILKTLANS